MPLRRVQPADGAAAAATSSYVGISNYKVRRGPRGLPGAAVISSPAASARRSGRARAWGRARMRALAASCPGRGAAERPLPLAPRVEPRAAKRSLPCSLFHHRLAGPVRCCASEPAARRRGAGVQSDLLRRTQRGVAVHTQGHRALHGARRVRDHVRAAWAARAAQPAHNASAGGAARCACFARSRLAPAPRPRAHRQVVM